jgi:hypothetical protein
MNDPHRYQVVTWSTDSGEDEKQEFPTIAAAKAYFRKLNAEHYYDGAGIWDHQLKTWRAFIGDFPEHCR